MENECKEKEKDMSMRQRQIREKWNDQRTATRPDERYCQNCSRKGHGFRWCNKPIVSFGVLAFQRGGPVKFLLIQRKDSIGFLDFVRGRYMGSHGDPNSKLQNIKILIEEMTPDEKEKLLTKSFDELWDDLWINHQSRAYINDYHEAKAKFTALDIPNLLQNTQSKWTTQEYGIPKGRRSNCKETDIECAQREFEEETGLSRMDYTILQHIAPIQEVFTGSNGMMYKHVYYLAEVHPGTMIGVDPMNVTQVSEVRQVGLFTLKEAVQLFREYDITKRSLLIQAHRILTS